ncbi:MAG TPA: hypothetical protein VN763_15670 [Saprospiraceae bacterium]|nr:hypothetical protein [Saprospiraceae bacterium]
MKSFDHPDEVREFSLQFGHYKDAKKLLDEAYSKGYLPDAKSSRVLTDFTGDAYRLIFEEGYDSLEGYEKALSQSTGKADWQKGYEKFKVHVISSHREILKQIM